MKCKFIKSGGSKCQANSMRGSDYCFSHNPDTKTEKRLAVLKGGLANKKSYLGFEPVEVKTLEDIKSLLSKTINWVVTGQVHCNNPAGSIGFLARCFLDVYEKTEINKRLDDLEKQVKKRRT
ncbi:hypothetical protein ACFL18_02810 [Patescibacteria group bacterium]